MTAPLREHAQRHFHRLWVRIVGVVDQHDVARQVDALEPSVRGLEAGEARGERLERGARGLCGGRGGERVHERRFAEPGDAGGDASRRRHELEREAAGMQLAHLLRAHIRTRLAAEAHDGRVRAPREPETVIEGDDGGGVRGESCEQIALLERDRLARAQMLDVRAAHVRDHAHARLHDRRERRDLAAVVHPDLDHHAAVVFAAAQQRQRHAELVVQVALRLEAGCVQPEDRRTHVLGGGLAIAAGDRDHGSAEARAVTGRERPEGLGRVRDLDHTQLGLQLRG